MISEKRMAQLKDYLENVKLQNALDPASYCFWDPDTLIWMNSKINTIVGDDFAAVLFYNAGYMPISDSILSAVGTRDPNRILEFISFSPMYHCLKCTYPTGYAYDQNVVFISAPEGTKETAQLIAKALVVLKQACIGLDVPPEDEPVWDGPDLDELIEFLRLQTGLELTLPHFPTQW